MHRRMKLPDEPFEARTKPVVADILGITPDQPPDQVRAGTGPAGRKIQPGRARPDFWQFIIVKLAGVF
jgi:hypothetical protein